MQYSLGPDVPNYDRVEAATVIGRVLSLPGGAELVAASLGQIPGAVVIQARSGMFRSSVASVQLGAWRYTPQGGSRMTVSHVVGGIVLSEDTLLPPAAAPHITAAVGQHVIDNGVYILPEVLALLEGLAVASG